MVETRRIRLDHVVIPDVRASSRMTPEQAAFFKATAEEFGIIQDPVVRPLDGGLYELIAGRTRILELAEKGLQEADVKVIEADEETALFMHLAENVARGSVDPVSVARVIDKLLSMELPVSEVARKLGRSETWIRRTHQLLQLPEHYQEAIQEGRLTPTHVQLALQMPTPYEADQALQTALRLEWNTSVLKIYVDNRLEELRRAKERASQTGQTYTPPPPDPESLVRYGQCLTCGYQVPREKLQNTLMCEDCRDLIKYLVDQLGAPSGAIQTVYDALVLYFKQPPRPETPSPPTSEVHETQ